MRDINVVTITGNMVKDLELRTYQSGASTARGVVAVNNRRKIDGQWQDSPSFIDIAVFGTRAETYAKYLKKGVQVTIMGNLLQERWNDKDGGSHSRLSVNVQDVRMASRPKEPQSNTPATQSNPSTQAQARSVAPGPLNGPVTDADNFKDDDIPF